MSEYKMHPEGYPSTHYQTPNGKEVTVIVRNITPDAVDYFTSVNAKLSTEENELGYILYADISEFMGDGPDDVPTEMINIIPTTACPFKSYDALADMCREVVDRRKDRL